MARMPWKGACVLGSALLSACGGSGTSISGQTEVPQLQTDPGSVGVAGTLVQEGDTRSYVGLVPQALAPGAPLLVMLHPLDTTNVQMANLTRVSRLAAQDGVVVALPQGENKTWNDDPTNTSGPDDVGFISSLIGLFAAQYQIDPSRVYVMGFSQGGFMAERLACSLSSQLAGGAEVGALLKNALAANCQPARRIPFALVNGTADPINLYQGISMLGEQSAPATAAFWSQTEGCSPLNFVEQLLPVLVQDGTTVDQLDYSACPQNIRVRFDIVNGGGHTWPGAQTWVPGLGTTSQNLDATTAPWQFLSGSS
jgi:polyhydroxybutyrate depolymerase